MPRRMLLYRCSEHRVYTRHRWQHRWCRYPWPVLDPGVVAGVFDAISAGSLGVIEGETYRYRQEMMLPGTEWRRVEPEPEEIVETPLVFLPNGHRATPVPLWRLLGLHLPGEEA